MKKKNLRRQKVIPVLPNLVTTANLFFGLLSIMTSVQGAILLRADGAAGEAAAEKFWWAAIFILIAGVLDFFDGKVARLLKFESNFGLSYDSLSDLVSFGVAPAVLIFSWGLFDSGKLGLMAVLFYAVCAALRLARFNVQSKTVEKYGFTGLPSPMGASLMYSPVLLCTGIGIAPSFEVAWFYLAAAPFAGLLMVSDVPYWKYPGGYKFSRSFNALVVSSIIITAVVTHPEIMIIGIAYVYCLAGLASYALGHLRKKETAPGQAKSEEANLGADLRD
ncbi:MAG: CDP-diacylglycerol--serine O-phosphatidyltransferase [Deltaproteobacteria bacterium]